MDSSRADIQYAINLVNKVNKTHTKLGFLMFPFEEDRLNVKSLLDALSCAQIECWDSRTNTLPLQIVIKAISALEDLIIYTLVKQKSSYELNDFIQHKPKFGDGHRIDDVKKSLLDKYIKGTDIGAKERSDDLLLSFQSRELSSSMLWANYFYAVSKEHGANACLNWLCASLSNSYIDDYYTYGDRLTLKSPIDNMTKIVTAIHSPGSSFATRYDALLLCFETNHSAGINLINQVEALKSPDTVAEA